MKSKSLLPRFSRRNRWNVLPLFTSLMLSVACGFLQSSNFAFRIGGGGSGNGGFYTGNPIANNCESAIFGGSPVANPPANSFFGMHINSLGPSTPWPGTVTLPAPTFASVQFAGIRLWDTGTGWAEINTAAGVCDFHHMDAWVKEAQTHSVDILYNLARTPTWASSGSTDGNCGYATISGGPGQCHPPFDLNSDGSGPDSIWIGWVTSVVSRYKGQIKYYEIWNEWNVGLFWVGTPRQLVRMTQDAYCVIEGPPAGVPCNSASNFPAGTGLDPNARIVTPSPVGAQAELTSVQTNMSTFLGSKVGGVGPGTFSDVIGFHCYVSTKVAGDYPVPEDVLIVISDLNAILPEFSEVHGKPLFCTEGGWGRAKIEGFTDPDLQAAFLARYYLLQNSTNVTRVYWYQWDSPSAGSLWSPSGGPTKAATAYADVYNWITGATLANACSKNGTVWTCAYTRPNGYQALAVWDANTAVTCYTALAPDCSTFTIPSGTTYIEYRDLFGAVTALNGSSTVPIGSKPILLETAPVP